MRILMVGLDAAGKTTILYKLKLGEGKTFLRLLLMSLDKEGDIHIYLDLNHFII